MQSKILFGLVLTFAALFVSATPIPAPAELQAKDFPLLGREAEAEANPGCTTFCN